MYLSTVKKLADYRKVRVTIPDEMLNFKVDESLLHEDLVQNLTTFKPTDTVHEGDIVTAVLQSDEAKYNKGEVPLAVGSALFNKGFELALVGMKQGESKLIPVSGSMVKAIILDISSRQVPVLAENGSTAGTRFSTFDEAKQYFYNKQLKTAQDEKLHFITLLQVEEVVKESQFAFDEKEVNEMVEASVEQFRKLPEEKKAAFGLTEAQYREKARENVLQEISRMLVAIEMAKQENVVINEETFAQYVAETGVDWDYKLYYTAEHINFMCKKIETYLAESDWIKWESTN